MDWLISMIASNPTIQARIKKAINGASLAAGAWALTSTYVFITTHFAQLSKDDASAIATVVSTAVAGLVLTIGSAVVSQLDVSKVGAKIAAAAITGSVASANDKALVDQVKQIQKTVQAPAGSPEALAEITQKLAQGQV